MELEVEREREREVDGVREVCTAEGLCGVCFGSESVLKRLPTKLENVQVCVSASVVSVQGLSGRGSKNLSV